MNMATSCRYLYSNRNMMSKLILCSITVKCAIPKRWINVFEGKCAGSTLDSANGVQDGNIIFNTLTSKTIYTNLVSRLRQQLSGWTDFRST